MAKIVGVSLCVGGSESRLTIDEARDCWRILDRLFNRGDLIIDGLGIQVPVSPVTKQSLLDISLEDPGPRLCLTIRA